MNITNYIQERIEIYTHLKNMETMNESEYTTVLRELQAVLSKIEKEEKEKKWCMRDLTK